MRASLGARHLGELATPRTGGARLTGRENLSEVRGLTESRSHACVCVAAGDSGGPGLAAGWDWGPTPSYGRVCDGSSPATGAGLQPRGLTRPGASSWAAERSRGQPPGRQTVYTQLPEESTLHIRICFPLKDLHP